MAFKRDLPFALTDNAYNDPQLGVFCTYVDSQDRFWHTSADTMNMTASILSMGTVVPVTQIRADSLIVVP